MTQAVAWSSELVKAMTEDSTSDDPVPLMDVKSDILRRVLEFCSACCVGRRLGMGGGCCRASASHPPHPPTQPQTTT